MSITDEIRQIATNIANRLHKLEVLQPAPAQALEGHTYQDIPIETTSGALALTGTELVLEPGLYSIVGAFDFQNGSNNLDEGALAVGQLMVNRTIMPDAAYMMLLRPLDGAGVQRSPRLTVTQTWLVAVWDYSQLVLVDGAWSYWRLNEMTLTGALSPDSTNNGRYATLFGLYGGQPPAFATDLDALRPSSMLLDGVTHYARANSMDYINGAAGTLEVWFKTQGTNIAALYGNANIATHRDGAAIYLDATGHVVGDVADGAGTNTVTSPVAYNDNRWHYAVLTWNGTVVVLYVDGANVAQVAQTRTPNNTTYVYLGQNAGLGTNFFSGYVAEAAAYPVALTAPKVKGHYNVGIGQPNYPNTLYMDEVLADNVLGWWRFNELSGLIAYDYLGISNGTYQANLGGRVQKDGPLPPERDGTYNAAIYMQAPNYVALPDTARFNPAAVTVEAWIRVASSGAVETIVRKSANGYRLFISAADKVSFQIWSAAANAANVGATSVRDNRWHHIVGAYDGVDIRIYVDGQLDSAAVASVLVIDYPAGNLRIANDAALGQAYTGTIDEVAIYGTALSAARILTHYLTGRSNRAWIALSVYKTTGTGNAIIKAGTKIVANRLYAQSRS